MRVIKNDYIMDWENERGKEMKELLAAGVLPYTKDVEERTKKGGEITPEEMKMMMENRPLLMGQCAGAIKDVLVCHLFTLILPMIDSFTHLVMSGCALYSLPLTLLMKW
jgi:hypothetical protein